MKYRGVHRPETPRGLSMPVVYWELHAGAYALALFVIVLTANK